eukprot:m.86895 g.86895  ORF g.86895 m.86895 type:complete len:255 (-) comp14484_c0_seq8:426-1190(-)
MSEKDPMKSSAGSQAEVRQEQHKEPADHKRRPQREGKVKKAGQTKRSSRRKQPASLVHALTLVKRAFDRVQDHTELLKPLTDLLNAAGKQGLQIKCWDHAMVKADQQTYSNVWRLLNRMKPAYEKHGWSWSSKENEMFAAGMHYILLFDKDEFLGYSAFMFDTENGDWVLYCYELHVDDSHKGKGYGKLLVQCMEFLCRRLEMPRIMLTVFKDNEAFKFYEKQGFSIDEDSPSQHDMDAPYEILSRPVALPARP